MAVVGVRLPKSWARSRNVMVAMLSSSKEMSVGAVIVAVMVLVAEPIKVIVVFPGLMIRVVVGVSIPFQPFFANSFWCKT